MIGVAAYQRTQPPAVGELFRVFLQVQHDGGASLRPLDRLDRELAVSLRLPAHTGGRGLAGLARQHLDFLGDDERRIEADAELTDQLRILLLVAGELAEEVRGAGFRDRPEMGDGLLPVHANAVVPDRDGARFGVVLDPDTEFGVPGQQFGVAERQEAELVVRVRGV